MKGDQVIAHHGTPLTPNRLLEALCVEPRHFCVSYFRPDQIEFVDRLAASYFIDNGAFSAWMANIERVKRGLEPIVFDAAYWTAYYEFVRRWALGGRAAWFVIPDVIDAGTQEQDALIRECPADLLPYAAPVWHMDEPVSRLTGLANRFGRVCIGSTAEYRTIGSPAWRDRMDEAFDALAAAFGDDLPLIHMLRGMQCLTPAFDYPFASVDSTDVARNHNRIKRRAGNERHVWGARQKANRWDALAHRRPPRRWIPRDKRQKALDFGAAA